MAKKKNKEQLERERKLIESGDPLYEVSYDSNTHLEFVCGNKKIGKTIWHLDTLAGSSPLKRKDGLVLTDIAGSCHGCCEDCCEEFCYARNFTIAHHNACVEKYAKNTLVIRNDIEKYEYELKKFFDSAIVGGCFRYHVSGEFDSREQLLMNIKLAKKFPNWIQYGYTKRYEWIEDYLDENGILPENFVVNISPFNNEYSNKYNLPEFIYDDGTNPELESLPHCPAVDKNGHETGVTCETCRRCIYAKAGQKTAVYAH